MDPQSLDLVKIKSYQREFAKARDWDQFHTPKNLTMALAGEAGELLELFQWLTAEQAQNIGQDPSRLEDVADELADILYYSVRLSDVLGIDLAQAFWKKAKKNEAKYPVELAHGNSKKYTELRAERPKDEK